MPKDIKEKISVKLTGENPDDLGYVLPDLDTIQQGIEKVKEEIDNEKQRLILLFSDVSLSSEMIQEDLEFINYMETKYGNL